MLTTSIIGKKITEARKKVNLSQAQLAERLYISPQAVGKWERGESMPDIITINKLAEILRVDMNYFSDSFISETKEIQIKEEYSSGESKKRNGWDMSRGNWVDADFSGLKDLHEKFSSSNMQKCLFKGSDMSNLLLKGNNVDRCDFSDSNLNNSKITRSNMANNTFINCSLKEAEFLESYVIGCDFSGADLSGVVFKSGGFQKNTISNTVWNNARFNVMYLADLVFEGKIEDCYFENCSFKKVTFQNTRIINTFFKGKSLKRIKFVECKVDKLTYAFLKNGKADLSGVTLLD